MTPEPTITGSAAFFIVKNAPAALAFHRDRFGFDSHSKVPNDDSPHMIDRFERHVAGM